MTMSDTTPTSQERICRQWLIPTWNPATMESPWPYHRSVARFGRRYRLVRL